MKRWAAWLLVIAFAACGPFLTTPPQTARRHSTIEVCLLLPTSQLSAATEAVRRWDDALGRWSHIEAVPNPTRLGDCGITVRVTDKPYDWGGVIDEKVMAWCRCVGCRDISMRQGHYEVDVTGVLEHELGHALGAQHLAGTLMDPAWQRGRYTCPDQPTVLQVAAWYHIDESLVTWCNP